MGSWFGLASDAGVAAAEGAASAGEGGAALASDGIDWDKLFKATAVVQGLTGAGAGSVPQFGPPSQSGTQQPQLIDLSQLMMQGR